jgi:glutaconate CoA-transferase, subunit A
METAGGKELRTVRSPYDDGEELVAMPALHLDAALVHLNRADRHGNAAYLGPDPYFDDLFCLAARRRYVSCEQVVDTSELTTSAAPQNLLLNRMMVDGVVESPRGAHFSSCVPDYGRDESFQRAYAEAAADPARWEAFVQRFLSGGEDDYQEAARVFADESRQPRGAAR